MNVEIFNKAEVTEKGQEKVFHFDQLTKEQRCVYNILCPSIDYVNKDNIEEYPMPNRCLEFVKSINIDDRFYKYEVWKSDVYEVKDPVLIGIEKDKENPDKSWYDKRYLLARWGKELVNFSELKNLALEKIKEKLTCEALKSKAELETFLSNPDLFCRKFIRENNVPNLYGINL